ncbi:MAG: hypothetical protein ABFQ65_02840 [Nanoarchaeota archaeon]
MAEENEGVLSDIKKRLECLILLECKKDLSEKEKLKIASDCLGMAETARMLNKDLSNFSKSINNKWGKKKNGKKNQA